MKWHESLTIQKIATWILFSVLVALVPFLFSWSVLAYNGSKITMPGIFGDGELFLVSAAIAAGALGEVILVDVPSSRRLIKVFAIGGCTLSITVSSLWFGLVASSTQGKHPTHPATVANWSLLLFLITFFCSLACIAVAITHAKAVGKDDGQGRLAAGSRFIQDDEEEPDSRFSQGDEEE